MRRGAGGGSHAAGRRGAAAGAALVGMTLLLGGCASPGSAPVAQVRVTDQGFSPAALTVTAGTEIRWDNQAPGRVSVVSMQTEGTDPDDGITATFVAAGELFDSGPLSQGEVYAVRLDEPGQYLYRSAYQDDPSWVGAITVEAP